MRGARIFAVWGQRGGRGKDIRQQQSICPWHLACWGPMEGNWGAGPRALRWRRPCRWNFIHNSRTFRSHFTVILL